MDLIKKYFFWIIILLAFVSCAGNRDSSNNTQRTDPDNPTATHFSKPPAQIKDTFFIRQNAAVFYHPDSLQLLQIKNQTDPGVFEASMHEFFYQMRNARLVIKKYWPYLPILEAKNFRYLVFIKGDSTRVLIDLDTKYDPYGLVVFNRDKSPVMIDMMNIETGISFYLR